MSRNRAIAIAIVALAVAALVFGVLSQRSRFGPASRVPEAPGWTFAIGDGLRQDWIVEVRSEVVLDLALAGADAARPLAQQLTGRQGKVSASTASRLQAKFYANAQGGWDVGARLRDVTRSEEGGRPVARDFLDAPFTFHLSPRGAVSGFRFTPGLPDEVKAIFTGVVRGLRVTLPERKASNWMAEEEDTGALRRTAYTLRAGSADEGRVEVTTRLLAIIPETDDGPTGTFLQGVRTAVVGSSGEAVASLASWTERSSFAETLSLEVGTGVVARTSLGYSARAAAVPPGEDPLPPSFAAFRALLSEPRWVAMVYRQTDPELDRVGKPLAIEGALAHFLEQRRDDPRGAERFLVNFLRQKPEMSERLLRLLDRDRRHERYPESLHLTLWRLVVEAGTPEAQRAVAEALLDPSYGWGSHMRAIAYAVDFENPGMELVDALWESHRNPRAPPGPGGGAGDEGMAVLAIGGVGWRDHQNAATRAGVATTLAANLAAAGDDRTELATTLKAIGNTGNDELVSTVRPYLAAEDEAVRSAACDSLRRMEGAEARSLLVATATRDAAPAVRERALQALREGEPDAPTAAWARERLGAGAPVREQVLLVEILGRTMARHPASEAALRALLVPGADPLVVEAVYRFVAPLPAGAR